MMRRGTSLLVVWAWVALLLAAPTEGEAKKARRKKRSRTAVERVAPAPAAAGAGVAPSAGGAAPATAAGGATPGAEQAGTAAAHRAFEQGSALYARGAYEAAIATFTAGYQALPDPVFVFNIAQAYRMWGQDDKALAAYQEYLRAVPDAPNRAAIERRIAESKERLAAASPAAGTRAGAAAATSPTASPAAGTSTVSGTAAAAAGAPNAAATATPAAAPGEDPAGQARAERRAQAFALVKQGRALSREKHLDEALSRLRAAVALVAPAGLTDDEAAEVHYALGSVLLRRRDNDEAVAALRRAAALAPKDADIQLELATALTRIDAYDEAIAAAGAALRLGLSDDDAKDAREVIAETRSQRLHDRLSIDGAVTLGYDTNVLQGTQETIGEKYTGGARPKTTATAQTQRTTIRQLAQDIAAQYRQAATPRREDDLPISLSLDVSGQPVGNRRVQLWFGYRFSQVFMTLPTFDHDVYNQQEHILALRLRATPTRWLNLGLRAEGFANFSGLADFSPFQGGVTAGLDATFIETAQLRTRLTYAHQYRAAFDRSAETYVNECGQTILDSSTYLDGNRDDVGLIQELRLRWLRARLGYQFHSDKTGVLHLDMPYAPTGPGGGTGPVLGCYEYTAPLSYFGHEGLLSMRFLLPLGFELLAGARYEYRSYRDPYVGVFRTNQAASREVPLDSVARRDHRIGVDASVTKALPRGFQVELTYNFLKNISTIANGIDNRNYDKHAITLWATYSF